MATMMMLPYVTKAQSKPKRDTSKDISGTNKKPQTVSHPKTVYISKQKAKTTSATKKIIRRTARTPKPATYLTVNGSYAVSKQVASTGGNYMFSVHTDGKDWSVTFLPAWCSINNYYSDSFVIHINPNTSHDNRNDWFKVVSDNQEVKVNITQEGAPINASARIYFVNFSHNVKSSTEKYLYIKPTISITNGKGVKFMVVAWITDEFNIAIPYAYGYDKYQIGNYNQVGIIEETIPITNDDQTITPILSIPTNAMLLTKKKNHLRCHVALYCVNTASYIVGANYNAGFMATKKGAKISTKDLN